MIEWMQTHRKWLVITIWVATIAFIGAGFVGWGQFQFGKSQSAVAKVGDTEVTIQDWQEAYNNLFQEVNQQLGGKLDEATAEKMGLKVQALQRAVDLATLRQYAKDLGLVVTNEDVAKKVLSTFGNEKTYKQYLRNIGEKPANFEEKLRKMILVEKLLDYLHLKPTKTHVLAIASALYNSDKMSVKVLNRDDIKVSLNEDEVKAYWEKHKNDFLTPEKYKIAYAAIPLKAEVSEDELREYYAQNMNDYKNEKGEILPFEEAKEQVKTDLIAKKLKKEAVITYKKLKNNELDDYKLVSVEKHNKIIPAEKMDDLIKNGYLKPFVYNNQYVTAKLVEEIKPQPMPYAQAKPKVTEILLQKKTTEALVKKAEEELKNFQGKDLGFVTKYDVNKIPELSPLYAEKFLFDVFTSQKPKGYVLIPENNPKYAVLYDITAQKLLEKEKYEKNKQSVYMLSEAMLNSELLNDLINSLKEKYKVVSYVK